MKLLLTNDDGVDAPGLATLEKVARNFGEVSIVAPAKACSGCGHQITFTDPIKTKRLSTDRYSVEGTPADCVRLAIGELVGEVDWVLSGINRGSNLGNDVFMSGTVAAAREATWLGQKAIAFSQYHLFMGESNWDWSAKLAHMMLEDYLQRPPNTNKFWNINFPMPQSPDQELQIPPVINCRLDPSGVKASYRSESDVFIMNNDYHDRPRIDGYDIATCFGGKISVTEV